MLDPIILVWNIKGLHYIIWLQRYMDYKVWVCSKNSISLEKEVDKIIQEKKPAHCTHL